MIKHVLQIAVIIILFLFYTEFLVSRALFYPEKRIEFTPASINLKYEDVFFKASDGVELHGWFVPAEEPFATVIYCHGNAGNISHRIEIAKMFNQINTNFFIFDYRGFGLSKGSPSEKGTYLDAQAAYDYLFSRKDVDPQKVVIFGKSLGGPIAIDLATKVRAAALISESSFTSTKDMARAIYPNLPLWLFMRQRYDAYSKIDKVNIPKLIIHSRNDEIVPFSQGQKLFNKAHQPKEFYIMKGGHNDAFYIYNEECMQKIEEFLRKWIK